ncbi:MAG: hypothetical protein H6868_00910 [Rhodospirillales bacterium]|nr:hypothetical protein [Rhodospirillales bacterium]
MHMNTVRKIQTRFSFFTVLFLFLLSFGVAQKAHALLLLDSYVFIGERSNSAVLSVKNTSKKPLAYKAEWTQVYMTPDGDRHAAVEGQFIQNVMPAEPYLYLSPRRMIVQADQLQNIRFMLRRKQDMPAGEYRSYIYLNPEDIPDSFEKNMTLTQKSSQGQTAQLEMMAGYRLPVFFLHGDTTLNVQFSDVRLAVKDSKNAVAFNLQRSGTRSAIGTVDIMCDAGMETQKKLAGIDVKVYTEIGYRSFLKPVELPSGGCSKITLSFMPHNRDPDFNGQPMAVAELPLR